MLRITLLLHRQFVPFVRRNTAEKPREVHHPTVTDGSLLIINLTLSEMRRFITAAGKTCVTRA